MNRVVSLALVFAYIITNHNISYASGVDNPRGYFKSYPISAVTSLGGLIGHDGNIISRSDLLNSAKQWNSINGIKINISTGCTYSDKTPNTCANVTEGTEGHGFNNGINEINLHKYPFNNASNLAVARIGFVRGNIVETDVYFNDKDFVFYAGARPSPCVGLVANGIEAMVHETGHMIGLGHDSPSVSDIIMRRSNGGCNQANNIVINPRDKILFNTHFNDSVSVNMINPIAGDVMFAGYNDLMADVHLLFEQNLRGGNLSANWESSKDGFLATGNNTIGFLTPGNHTITASVEDPQTGRTVGDSAEVSVVEDTFEIANLEPLPCVRLAGTNRCFMQYDAVWTSFQESCILIDFDEFTSGVVGDDDRFGVSDYRIDETCRSGVNPVYEHRVRANTWITASGSEVDDYRFRFRVRRSGITTRYENIGGLLPVVDTNISFNQDTTTCDLSSNPTCSIALSWQNHFFDVGTALYKRNSSGNWSFVERIDSEEGSLTYIASAEDVPLEFAVFQYSQGFGSLPGFPAPSSSDVVTAPAGLLVGPFQVDLISVATGSLSSNSPCTVLSGSISCIVNLIGTKDNTNWACTWTGSGATLGATQCWNTNSFSYVWPHSSTTCCTITLKAHATRPFDDPGYVRGNATAHALFNAAQTLDTEDAFGIPEPSVNASGTLVASNAPCSIQSGQSSCSVNLTGTKDNTNWACTWTGSGATLGATQCWNTDSFSYVWPHSSTTCCTITLKAHATRPFDDPGYVRGNATAHALFNAAQTLDTEDAFGIPFE